MQLRGFIDRQPGEQTSRAHHDHARVRDFLCAVIFFLRWQLLAEVKIDKRDLDGFFEAVPIGKDKVPLTGKDREEHVDKTIDGENPRKKEVVSQALRYVVRSVHRFPEPLREKPDQRDRSYSDSVYRVRMLICVVR